MKVNVKCELIENAGLPGLNIDIFNIPLDRADAARFSRFCEAKLQQILKNKNSVNGCDRPPPSYKRFLRRVNRKHSQPNRQLFELLGTTKIGDIRLKGNFPLHGWIVAALTNDLHCQTALDIVMLAPESMLSGIGIGIKGFTELIDWFKANHQLDPWPGVDPYRLHAIAVAIRVQKNGKRIPSTRSQRPKQQSKRR